LVTHQEGPKRPRNREGAKTRTGGRNEVEIVSTGFPFAILPFRDFAFSSVFAAPFRIAVPNPGQETAGRMLNA
jgi:hypothetical protein